MSNTDSTASTAGGALARQVAAATLSRLALNTARRFIYPFAPVFSRGLDVPLSALTTLVAACQAAPLAGLVSGPLTDRWGYRRMMVMGMGLLAVGMLAAAMWPLFPVLAVGLLLASFGKTVFDPAVQAYVGQRVAFGRRALVIGLMEFSWAGTTLLTIPLIGLLIESYGWRMALWCLGGAALACLGIVWRMFPLDPLTPCESSAERRGGAWRRLLGQRTAVGGMGFVFWVSAGNYTLFIIYGAWFENDFGLGAAALGASAVVIGGAELIGESLTAAAADRMGLKRSAGIGLAVLAFAYAALPLWGVNLVGALAGLFTVFTVFEFTLVTCLSLATELVPGQRATMMSGFFAAAGLGRVCGAVMGVPLWQAGGIVSVSSASTALTLLGWASLYWGLAQWRR